MKVIQSYHDAFNALIADVRVFIRSILCLLFFLVVLVVLVCLLTEKNSAEQKATSGSNIL